MMRNKEARTAVRGNLSLWSMSYLGGAGIFPWIIWPQSELFSSPSPDTAKVTDKLEFHEKDFIPGEGCTPGVWAREHISLIHWRSNSASTLWALKFPFGHANRSARGHIAWLNLPEMTLFFAPEGYIIIFLWNFYPGIDLVE